MHTQADTHVRAHTHIHTHTHTHTHARTSTRLQAQCTHKHTHAHTSTQADTRAHTLTHTHTHTHTHSHTHTCTHTHIANVKHIGMCVCFVFSGCSLDFGVRGSGVSKRRASDDVMRAASSLAMVKSVNSLSSLHKVSLHL
jgi:hypothetical protein